MLRSQFTKLAHLTIVTSIVLLGASLGSVASAAPDVIPPFKIQPHAKTEIPKSSGAPDESMASILPGSIKSQDVIRLTHGGKHEGKSTQPQTQPQLISIDLARGAGLAAVAWNVRLPDGRTYNLTGASPVAEIEQTFEHDSANRYRDNLFFQKGVVAPLYPLANRLLGDPAGEGFVIADVSGQKVKMPLNNTAKGAGAIPHHLHGLLFGQLAKNVKINVTPASSSASGEFEIGPDLWTGKTRVTTTHEISDKGISYHMKVKNIGNTPVPVGAGAHPYFASPDNEEDSIQIFVPAKKTAKINNLSDVLPTGELVSLKDADPALDFTDPKGTNLFAKQIKDNPTASRFDNLWVEPIVDAQGFAYCEVLFPRSKFKVRLTATTKNVIGIQGYAPKYVKGQKPFVVLELVTNLPDPRAALWGKTPTGMIVLKPGEEFDYGYRVELLPL